jgi:hypothetical protein
MATFVVGDVHGCYKSLTNLLKVINFNVDNDVMVSVGDLVDKGPKIKKCLDFFLDYGMPVVMGNHEEWIPRYIKGNKLKMNNWKKDTVKQLGDKITEYSKAIEKFPLYMQIGSEDMLFTVVHAGVEPQLPIESQHKNILLRIRMYPHVSYEPGKEEVGQPWQNSYTGHLGTILHGHAVCQEAQWHGNSFAYSLDGGCIYGKTRGFQGVLRCIRLEDRKVFEVSTQPSEVKHYLSL